MVSINGFDSDDYRYFRNKSDGTIKKYTTEMIRSSLFSTNLTYSLDVGRNYQITEFPKNKPFDLIEYIKMQKPIVFMHDEELRFKLDKEDFFFITEWIAQRIFSDEVPNWSLLFSNESYKEKNLKKMNMVQEDEVFDINIANNSINMSLIPFSQTLTNPKCILQFTHRIEFSMPCKKGEVWTFDNPAILFILLNQSFLKEMCQSEEILGLEKEHIFWDEYKDNVPGTKIKYYKIKEGFSFNKLSQLSGDIPSSKEKYNGYCSTYINWYARLNICRHNPNNYNEDGSFRYFYVEFPDTDKDAVVEEQLSIIADRLPQEETIKRYAEDQEFYERHKKEQEAEEYVKKHMKRYMKGTNRVMTPIEFMEFEEERKKRDYERVLTKKIKTEKEQ